MESVNNNKYKIALIGATGAVGKQLIMHVLGNMKVQELTLVVRKILPLWQEGDFLKPENKNRIKFLVCENFDDLSVHQKALKGYNAFLCTLGSRVKTGEENFRKVDKTYPLNFAELAKKLNVPYYGLCSSGGAKSSSWFLYMKVKGEVEEELVKVGFPHLDIYQPGLIANRENDHRIGETIMSKIPFIPSIQCTDLGLSILTRTIQVLDEGSFKNVEEPIHKTLNNGMLVDIANKVKM
jgi:hypothetical protein